MREDTIGGDGKHSTVDPAELLHPIAESDDLRRTHKGAEIHSNE